MCKHLEIPVDTHVVAQVWTLWLHGQTHGGRPEHIGMDLAAGPQRRCIACGAACGSAAIVYLGAAAESDVQRCTSAKACKNQKEVRGVAGARCM